MVDIELPSSDDEPKNDKTFSRIVALTVSVYAVALSIASLGGDNCGREIVLDQQQASNKWAHYQAKAAREVLYRTEARELELDLLDRGPTMRPEARTKLEALLADLHKEEQRMIDDKHEIFTEARGFEASRDLNMLREPYFDYGEVLLQIALVLASVAMLSESPLAFGLSILAALVGGTLSINAFFLIVGGPAVEAVSAAM